MRTSGGDAIFPQGLAYRHRDQVNRDAESFLSIQIKPAVNLSKTAKKC